MPAPSLLDTPTHGAEVVTRDGRSLPLVSARLRAEAQGGIARIVLEQRFENRHAETLHVTYRMPLPADGAVSGYAFDVAGRTIAGRVDRKPAARAQFEHAVASGKTAALLEQDRADIFTQSIGNLPAREALIARITIDQKLIWLPEGEWELRFPTVIGPRYVGTADTEADARATAIETRAGGVAARIQLEVRIGDAIAAGRAASSPSHGLRIGDDGVVELRDVAGARLDRDLVVRWPVAGAAVGLTLDVARPAPDVREAPDARAARGDDAFGLLTIVPPARAANARAIARDLSVLIDTSGSMSGGPLDKAKQVVALLIESLGDGDRLELTAFSSAPRPYKPGAFPATRGERQAAIRWLRTLEAGGGTEMRTAVIAAMRPLRPGSQRQVVLATDGYIGGEEQIVRQLHQDLPRSCRLHFLGVGSSVNRTLSTSLARAGRGAEVLCDLDEDAERAARRLIDRTRLPILTNVSLAGSAVIAQAPELLPDVFEAAPLVAAVKLRAGELVVRGEVAGGPWEQRLDVAACRPGAGNQAIVALYGREHVADLETRAFAGELADAEIEATGLAFQIATRFTSWIAVDEARVVAGPARHETMPQALPYGTTASAFGLRPPGAGGAAIAGEAGGTGEASEPEPIHDLEALEVLGAPAGASPDAPAELAKAARPGLLSRFTDRRRPAPMPSGGRVGKPKAGSAAPPPKAERAADKTADKIADKTAKAEAAPRDADEPWDRRESSALIPISRLIPIASLRANPAPEPAPGASGVEQAEGGSTDLPPDDLVASASPGKRRGGAPAKLPVAVARSVSAVERSTTAMGGAALRARRSWLSRLVVLVILALVIAALWWFVR